MLSQQEINKRVKFGLSQEKFLYNQLNNIFGNLNKFDNKYSRFDFYNNEYLIELKSRNCKYNSYPSSMVGLNKLQYKDSLNRKKVFIFNFIDGVYRWNADTEYQIKKFNNKDYIYIDINNLIKI